jgi:hypothetical protein
LLIRPRRDFPFCPRVFDSGTGQRHVTQRTVSSLLVLGRGCNLRLARAIERIQAERIHRTQAALQREAKGIRTQKPQKQRRYRLRAADSLRDAIAVPGATSEAMNGS